MNDHSFLTKNDTPFVLICQGLGAVNGPHKWFVDSYQKRVQCLENVFPWPARHRAGWVRFELPALAKTDPTQTTLIIWRLASKFQPVE